MRTRREGERARKCEKKSLPASKEEWEGVSVVQLLYIYRVWRWGERKKEMLRKG